MNKNLIMIISYVGIFIEVFSLLKIEVIKFNVVYIVKYCLYNIWRMKIGIYNF